MPEPIDNGEPIIIRPPTTIHQTARERLREAIRIGGIRWHEQHNPNWRGKPWQDGVSVDLDNDAVLDFLADAVTTHSDPDAKKAPDARS